MVLIFIIVPRLLAADLYRLMRMLVRDVIPIVRCRISRNGHFGDLIADFLAICIILRKTGKAVRPLTVAVCLYCLALYDCVAILYLYCDFARSDMVLIFIIVPRLLAADRYSFRCRCTRFLITYLKGMRARNNFHLYSGVILFNQVLYFIRLCIRICIENKVISMLGIIRFINFVSIRSLCFYEFICIIWRSFFTVQRCKTRKSKFSVTIRRSRAHLSCFIRDGSITLHFQFI